MVGSSQGGMSIEEVARDNPQAIIKEPVDITTGLTREQAVNLAADMGFDVASIDQVCLSFIIGLSCEKIWSRGYKTFFMLNSTEHEIPTAHNNKNAKE